jgi:glycine cleavage system H protein
VNGDLAGAPETVNSDAFGAGWLIKIKFSELPDLMTSTEYDEMVGE